MIKKSKNKKDLIETNNELLKIIFEEGDKNGISELTDKLTKIVLKFDNIIKKLQ